MLIEESLQKSCLYMLIDKNRKIYSCSNEIGNDCITLLKEFRIIDHIVKRKFGKIIYNNFFIEIKEVIVNNEKLYFIVLEKLTDKHSTLENSVFLDYHTGLYNRNLWEYLHQGKFSLPNFQTYSLILIDIDNLKSLNDKEGHSVGDLAIKTVAFAIKEATRKEDIVIRLGGDEFIILLPETDMEVSTKIINRVKSILAEKCKNESIKIDISSGISFGSKFESLENIAQRADYKMYIEKRKKKKTKKHEKQEMTEKLIEKISFILNNLKEHNGNLTNKPDVLKTSDSLRELINHFSRSDSIEK